LVRAAISRRRSGETQGLLALAGGPFSIGCNEGPVLNQQHSNHFSAEA
jgi:hypothetical protein